jgi:hypothetical protein
MYDTPDWLERHLGKHAYALPTQRYAKLLMSKFILDPNEAFEPPQKPHLKSSLRTSSQSN